MALGVVAGDRVGDVLHDRGLTGLGRRHDQGTLTLADRHDQVDHTGGQPVGGGLQTQPLVRVQRGHLGEVGAVFGRLDRAAVDAVEAHQRVELLPLVVLLAFLRHADRAGDGVAAAQAVLANHVHRDVDVVGAGQVARGADERVVVQHVEDAGDRLDDVVLAQFGVVAAAALAALPLTAAPTITEPAAAPTLTVVVVAVVIAVLVVAAVLVLVVAAVLVLLAAAGLAVLGLLLALLGAVVLRFRLLSVVGAGGAGLAGGRPALAATRLTTIGFGVLGVVLGSGLAGLGRLLGGRLLDRLLGRRLLGSVVAAGGGPIAAIAAVLVLLDGGDQIALAHTGGSLDANAVGQGTKLGQDHRGERAGRAGVPTGSGLRGGVRPRIRRRFCGHGGRLRLGGAFCSRDQVRIGHGFPFFPRRFCRGEGFWHSADSLNAKSHHRLCVKR